MPRESVRIARQLRRTFANEPALADAREQKLENRKRRRNATAETRGGKRHLLVHAKVLGQLVEGARRHLIENDR